MLWLHTGPWCCVISLIFFAALLQFAALQKDFSKRWANQSRAVTNLFKGPNQIEDIAGAHLPV